MKNEIFRWLKANLGKRCLAGLTGTDERVLLAASATIELYSYDMSPELLDAFRVIVGRMQRSQQHLAYHLIAKSLDWSDRPKIWAAAQLKPFGAMVPCAYEPGARP